MRAGRAHGSLASSERDSGRAGAAHRQVALCVCAGLILGGLADVVLGIKFEPELGDEVELRLKIIDVRFLAYSKLARAGRRLPARGMPISAKYH